MISEKPAAKRIQSGGCALFTVKIAVLANSVSLLP
ncbi:hypothetical protein VCSRO186_3063 [Vibrio cholerae]|nr:hypothetical protein VCSRO186_3063 [Vibrio cholerae]